MKLLTNEQINEIKEMQKALDERIKREKSISDEQDLSLEKYLALKTEFFEFVNEIESFKYWKENKGKASILEEACDTLHFILSVAIDNDVNIELLELGEGFTSNDYDMNEILGIMDCMLTDIYVGRDFEELEGVLLFMLIALDKCGYNADDLYNAYIIKNKVNHERQDNKY